MSRTLSARTLSALAIAFLLTLTAAAQDTWQLDPPHSSAQFSVRHLGVSTVRGAFTKVSGMVKYDPANPGKSSIEATIDAASVDTRVDMRDNDLRSPNFLDVQKFSDHHLCVEEGRGRRRREAEGYGRSHDPRRHQRGHSRRGRTYPSHKRPNGQRPASYGRFRDYQDQSPGFRSQRPARHRRRRNHPYAGCRDD